MNKNDLQQILTNSYSRDSWIKILREVFSVRTFSQIPAPIMLSANEIAENAFELGSLFIEKFLEDLQKQIPTVEEFEKELTN
jgi:hypothetical protein